MSFGILPTIAGQQKIAAALRPGGSPLTITEIVLGDGGGAAVMPSENRAEMVRQVHRQPVSGVYPHPTKPGLIVIEAIIPSDIGGFWIREIGHYDIDGALVTYGSFAATEKPVLADGMGRDLTIRAYLQVASASAVTIQIDPSAVLATQAWTLQQIVLALRQGERAHRARRHFLNQI